MLFGSDNWAGAADPVMAALQRANEGLVPAYGGDALTRRVEQRFAEVFDHDVAVFFVATGGAANGLALSALTPPWGMVLCHEEAHIQMDECAGPEFFTGGAKLLPMPGFAAKLAPDTIRRTLAGFPLRPPHGAPARVLSLTQATECGTVYTADELTALGAVAREHGLRVHLDGARFANAVAALDCHPADISWRAGVDVLCFGGTKNGALAAEAVLFFDPALAQDFAHRRKRSGHLWSKQRFLSAQFEALLDDGLWLRLASHANRLARHLSQGLAAIEGVTVAYPTDANEVFVVFPPGVDDLLREEGATFYPWVTPGDPGLGSMQRLICSFRTTLDQVEQFLERVRALSAGR